MMRSLIRNVYNFSMVQAPRLRDVLVYVEEKTILLNFPFTSGSQLFYINDQYTFNSLQSILELETQKTVELDLSKTKLDPDANLIKYFLGDQLENRNVTIHIQNEAYTLSPASQHREAQLLKTASNLNYTPMNIYKESIKAEMDPSHANTISWMMTQVNHKLHQKRGNITLSELDQIFKDCLPVLGSPVKEKIIQIQHQINLMTAEVSRVENERSSMEKEAKTKGLAFLSFLLALSIVQILFFLYGIYYVEEWGWDVCEPYTYTLQCVTVLLGIRFYMKYRKLRGWDSIVDAFFINRMKSSRQWKERWEQLNLSLKVKKNSRHMLEQQLLVYRNRMNYNHYVEEMNKAKQLVNY